MAEASAMGILRAALQFYADQGNYYDSRGRARGGMHSSRLDRDFGSRAAGALVGERGSPHRQEPAFHREPEAREGMMSTRAVCDDLCNYRIPPALTHAKEVEERRRLGRD